MAADGHVLVVDPAVDEVAATESESGGVPDERNESGARETSSPGARIEVRTE